MRKKVTSKDDLLAAAIDIAAKEGPQALSMRKLSDACGIAVGSVYNYFPDKDALLAAVSGQFWDKILCDEDKLCRPGMGFTAFLEQYYSFLYGRLSAYDRSWLGDFGGSGARRVQIVRLLRQALDDDVRVNDAIWNMEFNRDALVEYVFDNIVALLRAGAENCRFFIYLMERLLYE
ncbi:MAG: TetR/AcrR family transcriptional regulator [Clostridiales bacterium]|nr:TetR/AcrR family transcriptional regulator [Clostridiales bacterium]